MTSALRRAPWLTIAVVVVALGTRLLPPLFTNGLMQPGDGDAGIYFGAAQHLVDGQLPYRDFLFIQPPGIALLLSPFAGLSFAIRDATAFEYVRIAATLIGAGNAVLIARILRRYGTSAAAAGALLYAAWSGAAASESTALLEPLLNLALLVSLLLLRGERSKRAMFLIGLVLSVAVSIKIWAIADVVVLLPLLCVRHDVPRALAWLGGTIVGSAVLIGPFVLAAPGAAWRSIVVDQLGRAYDDRSVAQRLTFFLGYARSDPGAGSVLALGVAFGIAVLAGVVAVAVFEFRRARATGRLHEPGMWAALLVAHLALLAASPSFYNHYVTYAAAPLCLVSGWGAGRLIDWLGSRPIRWTALAAGSVVIAALAGMGIATRRVEHVRQPALIAFATQHGCVWSDAWQVLVSNDAAANEVGAGCGTWVDGYAHELVAAHGAQTTADNVRTLTTYQDELVQQFSASDGLIIDSWFRSHWSAATSTWVRQHFDPPARFGSYLVYTPRRP